MIRARFYSESDDARPIKWPIKHPYWITGYSFNGETQAAVIVAYADNEAQILEYWPEARDIETEESSEYVFTDRFSKPEWLDTTGAKNE